jgi:glycosyltransferase involved in cell wall biosynthesis
MKITAILAIRNEEAYLANCLRHLVSNGVDFVIIDNGSSDGSAAIYRRREFANSLVSVKELPFTVMFSLSEQLRSKMEVIATLATDLVVHLDADEVMHSNVEGETLKEALGRLDAAGWNAANFDEFVFLPIESEYLPEASGHQPIIHYYFFQPSFPRLIRAWRKARGFSLLEHGGHLFTEPDLRLAPEYLVLRHYVVRSQEHAFRKYTEREFSTEDLDKGWHRMRINQAKESFRFPPPDFLRKISHPDDFMLDRADPWKTHYWQRPHP